MIGCRKGPVYDTFAEGLRNYRSTAYSGRKTRAKRGFKRLLKMLVFRLITGVSDDDPSLCLLDQATSESSCLSMSL